MWWVTNVSEDLAAAIFTQKVPRNVSHHMTTGTQLYSLSSFLCFETYGDRATDMIMICGSD
jgi:hypothetical protein